MVRPTLKVTLNCMRCATRQFRWKILQISVPQYDKLTAWLDLLLIKVTLNCMRCTTCQFRWKILQISALQYDKFTAWLDLL